MQSCQPEFEIADSKKVILYDNYSFVINMVYLRCFTNCGVTLHLTAEMTAIKIPWIAPPRSPWRTNSRRKISTEIEKKTRKDPTKTLRIIYNKEVERTTDRVNPEFRMVKSSLYRARAKKCFQFQGPSELCRFEVHGKNLEW